MKCFQKKNMTKASRRMMGGVKIFLKLTKCDFEIFQFRRFVILTMVQQHCFIARGNYPLIVKCFDNWHILLLILLPLCERFYCTYRRWKSKDVRNWWNTLYIEGIIVFQGIYQFMQLYGPARNCICRPMRGVQEVDWQEKIIVEGKTFA